MLELHEVEELALEPAEADVGERPEPRTDHGVDLGAVHLGLGHSEDHELRLAVGELLRGEELVVLVGLMEERLVEPHPAVEPAPAHTGFEGVDLLGIRDRDPIL